MQLKIFAFVILDNHFHMICQGSELSKTMQSLKRHTSSSILRQLKSDQKYWILELLKFYKKRHKRDSHHQLWQEGFHPQQIFTDDVFRQKVEYVHHNPVERGYVLFAEHWYYSSAGKIISGKPGPISIDQAPI
jgi:putative transposase